MELIKEKFKFSPKIIVKNRVNRPNRQIIIINNNLTNSKITYEVRISSKKDIGNLIKYLEKKAN